MLVLVQLLIFRKQQQQDVHTCTHARLHSAHTHTHTKPPHNAIKRKEKCKLSLRHSELEGLFSWFGWRYATVLSKQLNVWQKVADHCCSSLIFTYASVPRWGLLSRFGGACGWSERILHGQGPGGQGVNSQVSMILPFALLEHHLWLAVS